MNLELNFLLCSFRLEDRITELESQLKSVQFKADLHSNIEKDIASRRSKTMKKGLKTCSTQTEDSVNLPEPVRKHSKSSVSLSDPENLDHTKDRSGQTLEPKPKILMKRSSSISKFERTKKKKKLRQIRNRRRRNNSEAECLSASLLSIVELLPSDQSKFSCPNPII